MKGTQDPTRTAKVTHGEGQETKLLRLSDRCKVNKKTDAADRAARDDAIWDLNCAGWSVRRIAQAAEMSSAHVQRVINTRAHIHHGITLEDAA